MIKKLVKIHGRPKVCLMLGVSSATLERYLKTGVPKCKQEKIKKKLGENK